MPNHPSDLTKLRRRDFLRSLGAGAMALTAGEFLSGCGSGSSSSAGVVPFTNASVNVNRGEIGGTGLTIQSLYKPVTTVGPNGSASAPVSMQGAQLQFAVDAAGKVRGMAVSNAAVQKGRPSLTFDAVSTAVGLIFLTPGILTVDPAEADARITQIKALPSFAALAAYLAQNLGQSSVNDLRPQPTLSALVTACVNDWSAQPQKGIALRSSRDAGTPPFSASWGSGPTYPVNAVNNAYRFESIVQQNLLVDGKTVNGNPKTLQFSGTVVDKTKLTGILDGVSLKSWGDLLFGGEPATDSADAGIQNDHTTAIVRLWIFGPGIGQILPDGLTDTPPDVWSQYDRLFAIGASVVYYLIFPVIDFFLGGLKLAGQGIKKAEDVWAKVQVGLNDAALTNSIPKDTKSFGAALLDAVTAILALGGEEILLAAGLPLAAAAVGPLLSYTAFVFALWNLSLVLGYWSALPYSTYFDLAVSGAEITQIQ